jgi:hypothetical protein
MYFQCHLSDGPKEQGAIPVVFNHGNKNSTTLPEYGLSLTLSQSNMHLRLQTHIEYSSCASGSKWLYLIELEPDGQYHCTMWAQALCFFLSNGNYRKEGTVSGFGVFLKIISPKLTRRATLLSVNKASTNDQHMSYSKYCIQSIRPKYVSVSCIMI